MSNPFILNRDVIASGGFLQVTASLAPSHWGEDRKYPMRSVLVEPNWESLNNWIHWVVGMCVHGQDHHISRIRWLFNINGQTFEESTPAGVEEDYQDTPDTIISMIEAEEFPDYRTTGPLTPKDQLSCRAWTRYDDDDEPALHQVFYIDWIKVSPTEYEEDGGFADLLLWYSDFGGDN